LVHDFLRQEIEFSLGCRTTRRIGIVEGSFLEYGEASQFVLDVLNPTLNVYAFIEDRSLALLGYGG
jgi:hypothetical protein